MTIRLYASSVYVFGRDLDKKLAKSTGKPLNIYQAPFSDNRRMDDFNDTVTDIKFFSKNGK
jgi:hypothetical protein